MRKKMLAAAKRSIIYLIIMVTLMEIGLRIFGFGAFELPEFSMISTPTRHLLPDENLGVQLNPGSYEVILNQHLKYSVTHLKNGNRTCGESNSDGPLIAFYGCSFTYGTGVNDEDVYPYILQQEFASLIIENRAVPGYGQAQILSTLKDDLSKQEKPSVIILNYLSFHNERNTLNTSYRQKLRMGYEITKRGDSEIERYMCSYPFGTIYNNKLKLNQLSMQEISSTFPLIGYFASMNVLQNLWDQKSVDASGDEKVTLAMIDRIHAICKEKGIKLIISTMMNDYVTKRFIAHCKANSIATIDIKVDLTQKGNTNAPYDEHPSAKAHKLYAAKLSAFLKIII